MSKVRKTNEVVRKSKDVIRNSKGAIEQPEDIAFGKQNYILILVGVAMVILGFILMTGGGSDDPNVFNEEIFSKRRITWAPLTVLAGYIVVMYAIMRKDNS